MPVSDITVVWVPFAERGRSLPEQPFDPDHPPPRIGQYEVLAPLGGGGMATVYLARGNNSRRVAVKLIRPNLAADEGFRQRFEREATYARRVRQRYIAPVLDFGYHQGQPFLVTEYIEGPTLEQAVDERRPMPAHEVEQLAEQVASALVAIHAVNLVHRDLKPSNVILGRTGPRVIDFGIARALDDSGGLTSQNVRLGTPSYMAPEQFDEDAEVGKPADVFAWGGLLIFASTGRPPFGTAGNRKEVDVLAHRIATREPRLHELEEPLRTLVRAAMAKDPDRRPTARDLVRRFSTGDQPTPAGAAPSTQEPAPTEPGPAATAPVPAAAFTAPLPPRPVPRPRPTARVNDGGWPDGNPADGAGVVMPAWTALAVRAGIALGAVIIVLLGWLILPEAARLLLVVGVGGAVVVAVGVGVWRYRPEWWWLPLGGLVLLLAAVSSIYIQLTSRLWVSFDKGGQVAVLQGAGPHGVLGAENITWVEPFGANRQELSRSPSLADALEDGIGVGDRAEGSSSPSAFLWSSRRPPTPARPPRSNAPIRSPTRRCSYRRDTTRSRARPSTPPPWRPPTTRSWSPGPTAITIASRQVGRGTEPTSNHSAHWARSSRATRSRRWPPTATGSSSPGATRTSTWPWPRRPTARTSASRWCSI
jgi:predicted Ser/Thr protein kinase